MNIDKSVMWSPGIKLDHLERMVIVKAYGYYQKNKTMTANALGISIRTLDNKLEKYEMDLIEMEAADELAKQQRIDFLARSRGQIPNPIQISPMRKDSPGMDGQSIANTTEKPKVSVQKRAKV